MANLNSSGVATITTTALPIGSDSITAAYAGDSNFGVSSSAAVTVTVSAAPPSFTVAASPATLTIARGQTGSATLTVTPTGGFSQAVSFVCSGLPAASTCSFSPASITPTGSAVSTTLNIATNVRTGALTLPARPNRSSQEILACLLLGGAGTLLRLRRLRRNGRLRGLRSALFAASLLVLCAMGLGSLTACGSSGTTPATPAGTSTVTVTATSGSIAQTASITLVVQ
jgi:hypothetical protein